MLLIFSVNKAYYRLFTFAVSTDQEMVTKKTFRGQGFFAPGKWTFENLMSSKVGRNIGVIVISN